MRSACALIERDLHQIGGGYLPVQSARDLSMRVERAVTGVCVGGRLVIGRIIPNEKAVDLVQSFHHSEPLRYQLRRWDA